MAKTEYDRYLEAEVLSADPVKLVWLLYRGAMDAVRAARFGIVEQRRDPRNARAKSTGLGASCRSWRAL